MLRSFLYLYNPYLNGAGGSRTGSSKPMLISHKSPAIRTAYIRVAMKAALPVDFNNRNNPMLPRVHRIHANKYMATVGMSIPFLDLWGLQGILGAFYGLLRYLPCRLDKQLQCFA